MLSTTPSRDAKWETGMQWKPWILAASAMLLSPAEAGAQKAAPGLRDGSRDFDFNLGTWHTEITRFKDPFAATTRPMRLSGTVTVRPFWNGGALLEEIEADGPAGQWQAATIFLYNPGAHQWGQYFVNSSQGTFATSNPLIGELRNGRVELLSQDSFAGRAILVRGTWSDIKRDSHSYQEDYSDDGGRSWHTAFIGRLTRLAH
jgi:hypothetical protein